MKYQKEKDLLLLATKLIEKILDSSYGKEYYKLFLTSKNKKLVKQLKIITQQPKTTENSNIIDVKSVTIEHSKALKIIRYYEKVFQVNSADKSSISLLYSETKNIDQKDFKKCKNNEIISCL